MITDLTNTSWVINDSYYIPSIPSSYTSKEYYINFTTGGDLSFVGIEFQKSVTVSGTTYTDNILYDNGSGTSPYVAINGGATWQDNSYKTVHISGGTDATNSSLISWFEANAAQIVQIDYIDKVVLTSGDEYYLKDSISGYIAESDLVAGNNIQISATGDGVSISKVNSDQVRFRFIRYPKPLSDLTGTSWYLNANPSFEGFTTSYTYNVSFFNAISGDSYTSIILYITQSGLGGIAYQQTSTTSFVYDTDNGWANGDLYRSIEFTGGDDVTNTALISWLEANATRVS